MYALNPALLYRSALEQATEPLPALTDLPVSCMTEREEQREEEPERGGVRRTGGCRRVALGVPLRRHHWLSTERGQGDGENTGMSVFANNTN